MGCALAALCTQERVIGCTYVCGRPARGRRDSSCSCCRGRPGDCPSAASTQRPLLRGPSAQRHRSASLVEEKPASREAPQQHTSRHPRSAALARILCPYGEPQQPVESCPCNALDSPALCCLGGPRRHTSTQGTGLWACTHLLLRPMQDSVRHPALLRTATDVYYPSHALPLQTNHQQRKPTRPPTTTTAATEILAIAPVERPLLFALEDAHVFAWLSRV